MSCGFVSALLFLVVLQWPSLTGASHFRHGNIAWAPIDSYSNTIRFTFRLAFRRSYSSSYNCDQSTIISGSLIGSGDSWTANCDNPSCSSTTIADTGFHCTDYSSVEDWSMGENNFTYTFPSIDDEWIVSYTSCCWISLSRYGNGNWLVSASVNLNRRSDNGRINSSPVSRSPAIVRWQEGCPHSLRIPVEDPDGDVVKCRWASLAESSINTDSFPYGRLDEKTCVLTYSGSSGVAGTYAVALTLEDFPAGTTNFGSISPFSAVGLQFLVIISGYYGSCGNAPVFTATTPRDGECSEVQIGSAYRAVIEAKLADFSKHIVEIVTSSPSGMQFTPLRYHGGVYYRNVTWNPNQYQVGQQLFCFKAVDSLRMESEWRCVTILVGLSNTPRVLMGSQTPRNPISKSGPGFMWWSIQFDRVIKMPRTSSYIRLVLLPNGQTVYKVDTLSLYARISSDYTTLQFAMPNAVLSMNGSYAIMIDHGAVVGQGCSYDGPPTPGITNASHWQFGVDGVCPVGYYLAPPGFTNCADINECGSHSRSKRSPWHHCWWCGTPSSSAQINTYASYSTSSLYDITPTPVITSSTSFSSPSPSSECSSYTYLKDSVRAQGFYNGYYGFYQCDRSLAFGWYRFGGAAGTQMPTSCVGKNRCSSHAPGWLNAPHPSVDDGIVNATVCFHWNSGCCHWTKNIRVRNCSEFYVYELGPTPACWLRYCGNGGAANFLNSSSDGISSTAASYSTSSPNDITPTPVITSSASYSSLSPSSGLRLVGGNWKGEGRVEVFHNGSWGTVCDDNWDITDARIVCRELGYPDALSAPKYAHFGSGNGQIWLDDVQCQGNESSIVDCHHPGWGVENCGHSEDASVICSAGYSTSSPNDITPTPVITSSASFSSPSSSSGLRLVGGNWKGEGRVEVFHNGSWGTVCDDNWDITDARIVCRELGYPDALSAPKYAHFGSGNGQIWLDDVQCQGNESSIVDCQHPGWGVENCGHSEDASVICSAITSAVAVSTSLPSSEVTHSALPISLFHVAASQIAPTTSSSMPSSLYPPSSSYALPTPLDFKLHVSADCAQICTNSPGSYSCSCVSGYRLASDGKSCSDINECATNNGGCSHHCYNIPGSFYCGCPKGTTMAANNLTCNEPGLTVKCGGNNITVSLEKQTFPFMEVSKLHLRYSSCRATENSTHFLFDTSLSGCGTLVNETKDALIFWNEIKVDAVVIDNVITRTHDINLPFYCSYSRKKMLSLSFKPQNVFFGKEVGYGNFTFRMDFYKSASFATPYTEKDYPISVPLNEYVYIKYSVESSADLVIMAENCKATKYGNFYSWPQYNIIQNGCPRDTTLDYGYDPTRSFQQFKIKTFRFFNDYDTVYFHCELLACHRYYPKSRCSRSCLSSKKRKRRGVTDDKLEHKESTSKTILTGGPILIKEKQKNAEDAGQTKQAVFVASVSAACGFCLVAVIALVVLSVKYRIARRLMNRNKVGDLYATQDDPMSRRNAYIQKDDTLQKEDSL